jgi:cysteine synthase
VRYRRHATEVVVADPEDSVFFDYYAGGDRTLTCERASRIEGIGRPRVEASFIRESIDGWSRCRTPPSIAAIHWLQQGHRPPRRRLHRHQPVRRVAAAAADGSRRASRARWCW